MGRQAGLTRWRTKKSWMSGLLRQFLLSIKNSAFGANFWFQKLCARWNPPSALEHSCGTTELLEKLLRRRARLVAPTHHSNLRVRQVSCTRGKGAGGRGRRERVGPPTLSLLLSASLGPLMEGVRNMRDICIFSFWGFSRASDIYLLNIPFSLCCQEK